MDELRKENEELKEENEELIRMLRNIKNNISLFHTQQKKLLSEYNNLKNIVDEQHKNLHNIIWSYIPSLSPIRFQHIPKRLVSPIENENHIESYRIGKKIGEGGFSEVYECESDEGDFVVKKIKKSIITDIDNLERINNEIFILSKFTHPNILRIKQVLNTTKYLYIIMPYGGKPILIDNEILSEDQIGKYLYKLLICTKYIHERNVTHHDIKCENILIDDNKLFLIDFGLSEFGNNFECSKYCGSMGYMAPEILFSTPYDAFKADIWSIGCCCLEMMLGKEKFETLWMEGVYFEEECNESLIRSVLSEIFDILSTEFGEELINLLKNILNINPSERHGIDELLSNPWVNKFYSKPFYLMKTKSLSDGAISKKHKLSRKATLQPIRKVKKLSDS